MRVAVLFALIACASAQQYVRVEQYIDGSCDSSTLQNTDFYPASTAGTCTTVAEGDAIGSFMATYSSATSGSLVGYASADCSGSAVVTVSDTTTCFNGHTTSSTSGARGQVSSFMVPLPNPTSSALYAQLTTTANSLAVTAAEAEDLGHSVAASTCSDTSKYYQYWLVNSCYMAPDTSYADYFQFTITDSSTTLTRTHYSDSSCQTLLGTSNDVGYLTAGEIDKCVGVSVGSGAINTLQFPEVGKWNFGGVAGGLVTDISGVATKTPTAAPTSPTAAPTTYAPTSPTAAPTGYPTATPTAAPTQCPTYQQKLCCSSATGTIWNVTTSSSSGTSWGVIVAAILAIIVVCGLCCRVIIPCICPERHHEDADATAQVVVKVEALPPNPVVKVKALPPKKDKASLAIELMIRNDPDGTWVEKLFEAWPVDGEPTEVIMANGVARKTWPLSWGQLEELLISTGAASDVKDLVHFRTKTVDNPNLPNITEESITWPSIQNLVRACWEEVNGPWVREEHVEDGSAYRGLLRSNTLSIKKEGLAKMLQEKGRDGSIDEMWEVYTEWPCVQGEEETVMRYNRKKLLKGIKEDAPKTTWPLPFEADEGVPSITMLMKHCGWTEDNIVSLKTALFDLKDETGVHPNCTPEKVCWPDLQQVFRSIVSDEAWNDSLNLEWPPLDGRKVMLRLKIPKDQIENTLAGKYRMYCLPDGGEAFSYGLIISDVQYGEEPGEDGKLHGTFQGRPVTDGKYEIKDGSLMWDPKTTRLDIEYIECWPGQEDLLKARIKSNCKFACESLEGFEQKATNETRNLPDDPEDRIGERAKPGAKKYYLYDEGAAHL